MRIKRIESRQAKSFCRSIRPSIGHIGTLGACNPGVIVSSPLADTDEPVARVVDRNGVYATGILIAPVNMRDSGELNIGQPLMVHDVKGGTLGDSLEIELWDILVSIDGHPADTLDALYERLAAAERDGKSVVLVFKRWSSGRDRLYDYVERALAVEDLEFVGPRPLKHVAAKD